MKKSTKSLLVGAAALTATAIIINKYIEYSATTKEITKSKQDRFYHWRDLNICYQVEGSGSPVLLIHDIDPRTSALEWQHLTEHLSRNHQVFTLDLVGCGKSDKPNITYICYYFVQLIHDFVRDVVQEKPIVLSSGRSFDAVVMADSLYKNSWKKIIAINPPAPQESYKVPETGNRAVKLLMELPVIGTSIYHVLNSYLLTKMRLQDQYYSDPTKIAPITLDSFYESAHLGKSNGKYLLGSIYGNFTNSYIMDGLKKSHAKMVIFYTRSHRDVTGYQKYRKDIELRELSFGKDKPHLEYASDLYDKLIPILNL